MKKKNTRESSLEAALDVLQTVFQKSKGSFSDEYMRMKLEKNWHNIVGSELAGETAPRKMYKTTLYVTATSSEAQYHCRFSANIIIDRINEFLGSKKIENLNFSNKPKEKERYNAGAKKFVDQMK